MLSVVHLFTLNQPCINTIRQFPTRRPSFYSPARSSFSILFLDFFSPLLVIFFFRLSNEGKTNKKDTLSRELILKRPSLSYLRLPSNILQLIIAVVYIQPIHAEIFFRD